MSQLHQNFDRSDATSLTLLARAQAMQPAAWERLVKLYSPLVRHWCRQKQLTPDDTADVFQEVFRAVAGNLSRFRRDRPGDSFRRWLKTITMNKIRDHFRSLQNRPTAEGGTAAQMRIVETPDAANEIDGDSEADAKEATIFHQSLAQTLQWIRGDFEDRTWNAFWQCQIEEKPTADVATQLQMTPAAVRKAKYRVIRRLREELDGLLD